MHSIETADTFSWCLLLYYQDIDKIRENLEKILDILQENRYDVCCVEVDSSGEC